MNECNDNNWPVIFSLETLPINIAELFLNQYDPFDGPSKLYDARPTFNYNQIVCNIFYGQIITQQIPYWFSFLLSTFTFVIWWKYLC